jgi:peptidoglycan/xylan/chitin deacetylase (PgdA/CDA1 family)
MSPAQTLNVVMYHYVRDLPQTKYPRLKAMLREDFRQQVAALARGYEMATLESALAFLRGSYQPSRRLCLLTFDDGLAEHYAEVLPVLVQHNLQGLFFVITRCMEEKVVAAVHMNHFLMAAMEPAPYREEFLRELAERDPAAARVSCDPAQAARTYPWDTPDVAQFKFLFNFVFAPGVRDDVVASLFRRHIGSESVFADDLYLSWEQAREMQSAGMVIGGHSHSHIPLARLAQPELAQDLRACRSLLDQRLSPQPLWPFSYPYGKHDSFNAATTALLKELAFDCSFASEVGVNEPRADLYAIRRIDCKVAAA